MKSFVSHEGIGVPLRRSSVDTDQILPSKYLKLTARTGFEDALFAQWREDDTFILNDPAYANASVLVTGRDFGIGSSREGAVWALQDYGFRVVIAPSFGDIFRTNAAKAGLLVLDLGEPSVEDLMLLLDENPGASVVVDLEHNYVKMGDRFRENFQINDDVRWRLLNGLDEIQQTLSLTPDIMDFERVRPAFKPTIGRLST